MPILLQDVVYRRAAEDETTTATHSKSSTRSTEKLATEKASQVPVPIPEISVYSTEFSLAISTVSRTTLEPFSSAVPSPVSLALPSSLSLPSIVPTTLNLVSTTSIPISHSTVSQLAPSSVHPTPSPSTAVQTSSAAHKLPVAIIAVLAVGSAFILLGIFIFIRACTRPMHRTRPTPSLPILDDAFADDNLYSPTKLDSPLFGGKERLSSQNGSGGPAWTWTQYAEAKNLPPLTYSDQKSSGTETHVLHSGETVGPNDFLFPRPPPSQSVPTTLISNSNALTAAASKFSIARSVSVYPVSPVIPAIDGKNYTADGYAIMSRNSKISLRRSRSDMTNVARDVSYDETETKSPQFLAHFHTEAPSAPVGRTRIKSSYYTPGSYPRISSLPSTKTKADDVVEFKIEELPPIRRTDSRKERDTRALTSALGLPSPTMDTISLSPTQTLYPEDSLSVAGRKHSKKKPAADAAMSPVDTSTALGTLMLMDFGTNDRSLTTLAARLDPIEYSSSDSKGIQYDRPPRVPSPPLLPSLAQMGLEHANPEAYAEYRSPTYSIFGLYGEDRKSRLSMHR